MLKQVASKVYFENNVWAAHKLQACFPTNEGDQSFRREERKKLKMLCLSPVNSALNLDIYLKQMD